MTEQLEPRPKGAGSTGTRFLENLAYLVPGYRGYKEKELRREEDARLRSRVLAKLRLIQTSLEDRLARLADSSLSKGVEVFDQRIGRIEGIANAVRFAPYGFSGFFDAQKVREETLEQVLECDLLLFQDLEDTTDLVQNFSPPSRGRSALESFLEALDGHIRKIETRLVERDKVLGDH